MKKSNEKILFVHYSFTSFIKKDYEILDKHFNVNKLTWKGKRNLFSIARNVLKSDIALSWFAGDPAAIMVFFSRLFGKRSIVIVGGFEVANIPDFDYGQFSEGWIKRFLTKYALKKADLVLPVSKFTKDEINKIVKPRQVQVLYNGIDTEKFKPSGKKKNIVLIIGNVTRQGIKIKGLETFARASNHFPDHEFVVIGKYEKESMERLKEINHKLTFTGLISHDEVLKWLQQAKIYCQLSYVESFGMGVAEAMSCECIPIVTKRGALPELVGDKGFFVEYDDNKSTINAIEKAMKVDIDFKKQYRERIISDFNIKNREKNLLDLIIPSS